tara:strand:+ start:458 stop:718 length:261 start_codon:yes stop_codon:yes gene_type:complete
MGVILDFPKQKTRAQKSKELRDQISLELVYLLENKGIKSNSTEFVYNMAWVVKFIEVLIDTEMGIPNDLSKHIQQFKPQEFYEKTT